MKRITIKDIAQELCISVSTVSRALADDKNIRKETKEKVLEKARQLGYKPNPVATNLKFGHSNTVGVIVPEMITPFAATVISGIHYMKSFFLVEKLIRSGRKKIVHIQGPTDIYNSIERAKGYSDAMEKFHLSAAAQILTSPGMGFEDGQLIADRLLDSGNEIDAVFAFTDTLAIGIMNRLRERGKQIPEDVAIASFSGTALSTIVYPPLSTVEPPLYQMGKHAAELILEKIKDPSSPCRSIILNAEIKIRASVMETPKDWAQ